jgi:hypothetical protein
MSNIILSKDAQISTWDFAVKLSKSKMVPAIFHGKPEDIFVSVLYGNELGLAPIMSLNSICVIQGQVTLKVQTMNAIVRSKHPDAVIEIVQDENNLSVTVKAKRNKEDAGYTSFWDMNKAKLMGLASKNNWQVQPMNMLKARALSDALRTVFPDSLLGLYSQEEMEDLPPIRNDIEKDIDKDFPIPPEEKTVGDLYRVQNGKLRGKQLKDLSVDEISEYREELIKRTTPKKEWELELISVFSQYLNSLEPVVV